MMLRRSGGTFSLSSLVDPLRMCYLASKAGTTRSCMVTVFKCVIPQGFSSFLHRLLLQELHTSTDPILIENYQPIPTVFILLG